MRLLLAAFLALVCLAQTATAAGFRLVDLLHGRTRPDFPGEPFVLFRYPVLSGTKVVFLTARGGTIDAVWRLDTRSRSVKKLAGLSTRLPGSPKGVSCFCHAFASDDVAPTVGGGKAAFYAMDSAGAVGIYLVPLDGGPITRIASSRDREPGGWRFTRFGRIALSADRAAFRAETERHRGLYVTPVDRRAISRVIDERTRLPARRADGTSSPDYFGEYTAPTFGKDTLSFYATGLFDPVSGPNAVFRPVDRLVIDHLTPVRGGTVNHLRIIGLSAPETVDALAFRADQPGTGYAGIFRARGASSPASRFVSTRTVPPGYATPFHTFNSFSYDASGLAFMGTVGDFMTIGFTTAPGAKVEIVASEREGYYKPSLGDRSVSDGRIVFREDGGANRLLLAVPR